MIDEKRGRKAVKVIRFKACPRCHGDVQIMDDRYGPYTRCFQCGHASDVRSTANQEPARIWGRLKPGRPRKGRTRRNAA